MRRALAHLADAVLRASAALLLPLLLCGMAGCHFPDPQLDVSHAMLAGDQVFVEVHAYRSVMQFWEHTNTILDSHYYLLRFPLRAGGVVKPAEVIETPHHTQLECSYSSDRLLLVDQRPSPDWAWGIHLLRRDEGLKKWVYEKEWRWKSYDTNASPFVVSIDGHYLCILGDDPQILDTANLKPVHDEKMLRSVKTLRGISLGWHEYFELTQNGKFIVFDPGDQLSDKEKALILAQKRPWPIPIWQTPNVS